MSERNGKKRKVSKHEQELSDFVFGKDITASFSGGRANDKGGDNDDDGGDEVKALVDRKPKKVESAAWQDDDDNNLTVNLQDTSRLRKFRKDATQRSAVNVSGTELSSLLQERFKTRPVAWADAREEAVGDNAGGEQDTAQKLLRQTGSMHPDHAICQKAK